MASMAQPTFLQQFGPLIAALVALIGVGLTLIVNGRREAYRNRLTREDEYRKEQRQVIAAVVVAAHNYRRDLGALSTSQQWVSQGRERVTSMLEAAEKAKSELLNQLTMARLLVHSIKLQQAIDKLYLGWSSTSQCIGELVDAFWSDSVPTIADATSKLNDAWPAFDDAGAVLQSVALEVLRPTITQPA